MIRTNQISFIIVLLVQLLFIANCFNMQVQDGTMILKNSKIIESTSQDYVFKIDETRGTKDFIAKDNTITKINDISRYSSIFALEQLDDGETFEVKIVSPNQYYSFEVGVIAQKSHNKISANIYPDGVVLTLPDNKFAKICGGLDSYDSIIFEAKASQSRSILRVIEITGMHKGKSCGGLIYNIWPDNEDVAYQRLMPHIAIGSLGDQVILKLQ